MAISSAGIGSGLDVAKIVEQMVAAEKIPLKKLEVRAEGVKTQISTYGEIKSLSSKLGDIVSKLTRDSAWNGVNISSSNSTISGMMTGIAAPGSYNIRVTHLAQTQTTVVGGTDAVALAKDTTMGASGSITLKLGSGDSAVTKKLDISSSDTLTKIAVKVNEAGAGIQASVVTDVDGKERLMLRSKDSGTSNSFTVDIDPALTKLGQTQAQQAQNAKVQLNGVEVESNSNTFANTIPGMSFSVSEVTTNAATLTAKNDTDTIKKNIQEFVDVYNELNTLLSQSTKYVEESKTAGVLQGDSATVSLQNSLRMLTQGISDGGGSFKRLADIGIQMREGGGLTVDGTKMDKGLAKVDDLKALFANKSDALGQGGGIAVNFKVFTDKLLAFDGTLNTKTDSLERTLKNNGLEQDKVNSRAEKMETRLYQQYSALDGKMASLNSLSSYVSQMVTTWNQAKN